MVLRTEIHAKVFTIQALGNKKDSGLLLPAAILNSSPYS